MATVVDESGQTTQTRGRAKLPNYFEETGVEPGSLEGVPGDYTYGSFEKLKKSDFANQLSFENYRLWHVNQRISKLQEDKDEIEAVIRDLSRYDSEEQRQKVAKARAAEKRLAKLLEGLDDEGIDYREILEDLQRSVSK